MDLSLAILPEGILLSFIIVQLCLLAVGLTSGFVPIFLTISFLGSAAAAISAFFLQERDTEGLLFGFLQTDASFLYVRISILIIASLLILFVGYSSQMEEKRKPEACFFILNLAFFGAILILSRHLLVSFICLSGIGILSALISALPFFSTKEGEASIKFWYQTLVSFTLGFGCLVLLLNLVGDLSYASVHQYFLDQQNYFSLPLIGLVLLPFWSVSGIFPFHFVAINQNHASIWPVQATLTLLVQGVGTIAMFKVIVLLFYFSSSTFSENVLGALSILGVLGAFYGGFGALTQTDSKKFAADFSLMQWSICLITLGNLSSLSISATIFHFISVSIALAVCFVVWGALHEEGKSNSFAVLRGIGSRCVFESLLLLTALVSLAGIPPFVGFPTILNMIDALFEQKQLSVLMFYVLILAIQLVVISKMIGLIFFEKADDKDGLLAGILGISSRVRFALVSLIAPLLLLGIFWEGIWTALVSRANNFINY